MKYVDPDGREIGEYYDAMGNYLGWDGKTDRVIHIVDNMSDQKKIISNRNNHRSTPIESLSKAPVLSTSYDVLSETQNVFNRASNGGFQHEESSILNGVQVYRGVSGERDFTFLPYIHDDISMREGITIHSHPDDANDMSPADAKVFMDYHQNIIVGPVKSMNHSFGAAFYGNTSVERLPIFSISMKSVSKILSSYNIKQFQYYAFP